MEARERTENGRVEKKTTWEWTEGDDRVGREASTGKDRESWCGKGDDTENSGWVQKVQTIAVREWRRHRKGTEVTRREQQQQRKIIAKWADKETDEKRKQ